MRRTGATARQLGYWRETGYLKPKGAGGSGTQFYWPQAEVEAAAMMVRLVGAGVAPAAAARAARNGGELAPGVRIASDLPWEDTRWYRVLDSDGDEWCETSNLGEAADAFAKIDGGRMQRLQERRETRWIDIEPGGAS
jgi:DNA-binding transcriptional MerR regulator